MKGSLWLGLALAAACSNATYKGGNEGPSLSLPARFAEGKNKENPEAEPSDAGTDGRELVGAAANVEAPPDPEALREARQFEYSIKYDKGTVSVAKVRGVRFPQPVVTARTMGRFAIELWIGHELVERVRFDFPLVAAEEVQRGKRRPLNEAPSFAAGVVATQTVLVPASERATRAVLLDRATGAKQELPWPPDAPLGPPISELSPVDAGRD
jgi:hypothetical protein